MPKKKLRLFQYDLFTGEAKPIQPPPRRNKATRSEFVERNESSVADRALASKTSRGKTCPAGHKKSTTIPNLKFT